MYHLDFKCAHDRHRQHTGRKKNTYFYVHKQHSCCGYYIRSDRKYFAAFLNSLGPSWVVGKYICKKKEKKVRSAWGRCCVVHPKIWFGCTFAAARYTRGTIRVGSGFCVCVCLCVLWLLLFSRVCFPSMVAHSLTQDFRIFF